ncbi:hypothetical protein [Kitasatospora sp. NPDC057500]|uniref:hypothetical protein n=1 Tax=Kitasatospora sp. NPDC057500 TaxID=3346151 RepID=UPI003674F84C
MTALHSRNADAADAAGSADVKDTTDTKAATDTADSTDTTDVADTAAAAEATADTDLREELGRYAELGAFTLAADTHPWYAAVDTVATPEEARAASTVLAELRGHDLQQVWEDVTALAADVKLDAPDTVGKTAVLVEMLQLVRRTSAVLAPAAYDADLEALIAATADRNWRRERGVKLSWLRARSLRKQAGALAAATTGRTRAQDLHEALASAEVERRAWAALAPAGTLPTAPSDADLAHRTAQTFEAINTGVRELARLLPGQDLDALSFPDLVDLVERLAADEGTLYRLPTLRGLRATLEDAGLADLLTELAAAHADRRAAEAAYAARQALAGGQRDGLAAEPAAEPEEAVAEDTDAAAVEPAAEAEEPTAETPADEEPLTVTLPAPSPAADDLVGVPTAPPAQPSDPEAESIDPADDTEPEQVAEVSGETPGVVAGAEPVAAEAEPVAEVDAEAPVEAEPVVEASAEAEPVAEASVEAPDAAADVESAAEAPVEVAADAESVAVEVEPVVEASVEAEPAVDNPAEPTEVVAETPVAEASVEVEPVAEAVAGVEPVAEVSVEAVAETVVAEASVEVEPVAEAVVEEAAESVAEAVAGVEAVAEVSVEAVAETVVAEASVEVEPVVEAGAELTEVVADAESAAVEAVAATPVAEAPVEVEPVAEAVVETEVAEPVAEAAADVAPEPEPAPAPAAEVGGRPEKPDFTPGRPVTAYSAEELLAIVRWVDGDGVERSDEELLRAAMKELGFARLGPRIKEALGAAVAAARG